MVKKIQPEQPPSETRYVMLGTVKGFETEDRKDTVLAVGVMGTLAFILLAVACFHYCEDGIEVRIVSTHSYQSDEEDTVRAAIDKALEEMGS